MIPPRIQSKQRQGSVLIVTLILGTAIALALGSFVAVTINALKLSQRSFFSNSSLNLAEAGLEEALHALNTNDWTGWTTHSSGSDNKFYALGPFDLGQGAVGDAAILVYNATSSGTPRIIAQGETSSSTGSAIIKQIEVKVARRSHWATGMVAKETITFSGGNVFVDSYDSTDPNFSTGGLYDSSKKKDNGTAGSASVSTDAVAISNSDIWGYVATGGSPPVVGPNGSVKGEDTPAGVEVDPNRITTDFNAEFDPETPPTSFDAIYPNISGNATLGSAGTSTTIKTVNMSNTNGKTIEVLGDVTLVVTNTVDLKGNFFVRPDSTLTLYVEGDMFVGGNGQVNETGLPKNLVVYGTAPATGSQTIKLHGNGVLHAAVYAPNANVEMKGGGSGGELSGSVIGKTITVTGNYQFHYDESLADEGGDGAFAITSWRELDGPGERVGLY